MANGENHMRGINVGSRKAIIVNGVLKGTFLTFNNRTTFVFFKEDGRREVRVRGPVETEEEMKKIDPTHIRESYFTCECVFVDLTNQVKVILTHNSVPEWNCEFVVDFTPTWVKDFYNTFNELQKSRGRETHVANPRDMTV
jgi:hypothetical protein